MLESVAGSVPGHRQPAIEEERKRLDVSVAHAFADSVDLDRANNADPQGLGGRSQPRRELDQPPSGPRDSRPTSDP